MTNPQRPLGKVYSVSPSCCMPDRAWHASQKATMAKQHTVQNILHATPPCCQAHLAMLTSRPAYARAHGHSGGIQFAIRQPTDGALKAGPSAATKSCPTCRACLCAQPPGWAHTTCSLTDSKSLPAMPPLPSASALTGEKSAITCVTKRARQAHTHWARKADLASQPSTSADHET